jgi:carbon monoxide dehydrogenase subunit G
MIELTETIEIRANSHVVWAFLTDVQKSLSFNRFHVEITVSDSFSVNSNSEFYITHNFGFGNYKMTAKVVDYIPAQRLSIDESIPEKDAKGFPHNISFEIFPKGKESTLSYSVNGTYGGRVQDMSFKPILKGVMKDELKKIKQAIESAEKMPKGAEPNSVSL